MTLKNILIEAGETLIGELLIGATIIGGFGFGMYSCAKVDNAREEQRIANRKEQFNQEQDKYDALWQESNGRITGTVVGERYGIDLLPSKGQTTSFSSNRGLFSRGMSRTETDLKSIKIYPFYELKVKTEDGKVIAINVLDSPTQPKEALDMLINEGTKISFPKGTMYKKDSYYYGSDNIESYGYDEYSNETFFGEDTQIGSKRADRIKVLSSSESK